MGKRKPPSPYSRFLRQGYITKVPTHHDRSNALWCVVTCFYLPETTYGGKQKMLRYILPIIPEHKVYTEAFLGGGAVFWAKQPAKVEFVNDTNGEVINFYRMLKLRYPELKKEIDATLHSEGQQKEARQIYFHPEGHGEVKRAWAVYILSHQSFYSILGSTWKCSKSRSSASQFQARKEAFADVYQHRLEHTSIFCRDALLFSSRHGALWRLHRGRLRAVAAIADYIKGQIHAEQLPV